MPEICIQVESLSKTYRGANGEALTVLDNISFEVPFGSFVSVVGPSGCGKTTLLKILAGLLSKTDGKVFLNGEPVTKPRADIGFVFQDSVLLPWRTVLENVMLPAQLQGLDQQKTEARSRELLNLVELTGFEDKRPFELSGGMQQRVAIARALIHDPAVLYMDEPFGSLDAITREYMNLELLRIWRESGKTVLMITHSIPESVFLADEVIVLSARPGCLLDRVRINLPRPRELAVLTTPMLARLTERIRGLLSNQIIIDR